MSEAEDEDAGGGGGFSLARFAWYASLVLNFLFILPFILAWAARIIPPSEWFFPTLLALLQPWWVVLPLIAGVVWVFFDNRVAAVNFVLAVLLSWGAVGRSFEMATAASESRRDIRVFSFNAAAFDYNYDKGLAVLPLIDSLKPDIVCIQEYYSPTVRSSGKQRSDFKKKLKEGMGLAEEAHVQLLARGPYGLAVFSRYPIRGYGAVTRTGEARNGVMYADLRLFGQTLRIYNLHLESYRFNDYQRQLLTGPRDPDTRRTRKRKRRVDARLIWQTIKSMIYTWRVQEQQMEVFRSHLEGYTGPTLVCADLNQPPYTFVHRKLTEDLACSFEERGSGRGKTFGTGIGGFRIDYVLGNEAIYFKDHQVVPLPAGITDHKGLLVRLELRKEREEAPAATEEETAPTEPTPKEAPMPKAEPAEANPAPKEEAEESSPRRRRRRK